VTSALELAERALAAAEGDEAEVVVHSEHSGLARAASSEVHQPTLIDNTEVTMRIVRDGRVGVAATNRTGDEHLRALARRAHEIADSAPPDPHFPGLATPSEVPSVAGYDEETDALAPADLARLASSAIGAVGDLGYYGYVTAGTTEIAIATTAGIRVSQRLTDSQVLALAAADDASGYAERSSWAIRHLDPAAAGEEAAEKASRTRGAVETAPAPYRAVLEPYALAELLQTFAFDAFNGLAFVEKRSFFSDRIGERVFDERITISDDAIDPAGLPKSFDFEGVPKRALCLVRNGVAENVVWDRATAARAGDGQVTTGHAPPSAWRSYGPIPFALEVAAGQAESTEELAEAVGDGIYVTRLHYLNTVEPRSGIITGMTRDGTFRIRDGKIAEPLVNLRFTVAVPEMLADVPALTRDRRPVGQSDYYDERYPTAALVPAIATGRFNITGVGSRPGL
jgi:PmbA protein